MTEFSQTLRNITKMIFLIPWPKQRRSLERRGKAKSEIIEEEETIEVEEGINQDTTETEIGIKKRKTTKQKNKEKKNTTREIIDEKNRLIVKYIKIW